MIRGAFTTTTTWLFLLTGLLVSNAQAHKPSDSYLRINVDGDYLAGEWDIALKDLELLIGIDADQNNEITWGEVKAQERAIVAHALSRLQVRADGEEAELRVERLMANRHSDGGYVVLVLASDAPGDAQEFEFTYDLLFDVDPTHRGLVLFRRGEAVSTHVLTPDDPSLTIRAGEVSLAGALVEYLREGVIHIWIGYDHILFLLSLLLPAVWLRRDNAWQPVEAFRPACYAALKIVSVFTLAHSITLWLAVMEYVRLPSQMVEATIALSIIVTVLHNVRPVVPMSNAAIAFVFGLVHGFGFANVLIDLGLSNTALAVSLLGFNLGVELGQIAIVLAFLPVAFLMRGTEFYRWVVFGAGSALIAIVSAIWFYERVFNAEILGF